MVTEQSRPLPNPGITPNNQYRFACPVVGRDALYMACQFIKYRVWRGEPVNSAPDCKCAMRASKCPAVFMMRLEDMGDYSFFSESPTVHNLLPEVVERVKNVLIVDCHTRDADLTVEQRAKLLANDLGAVKTSVNAAQKGRRKTRNVVATTTSGSVTRGVVKSTAGDTGPDHVRDTSDQLNEAIRNATSTDS